VSPEQLDANWKAFLEKWPGAPTLFFTLESQKHRFCAAYTHKHLLLFQTGNSVAESTNSSIDAFLNENKPHTELVQVLIQHQSEQNNRERRQLFISCKQLPDRLASVSNCDIRNCLSVMSDTVIITEKFKEQLEESLHYTACCTE
jgi:hypothetical protein